MSLWPSLRQRRVYDLTDRPQQMARRHPRFQIDIGKQCLRPLIRQPSVVSHARETPMPGVCYRSFSSLLGFNLAKMRHGLAIRAQTEPQNKRGCRAEHDRYERQRIAQFLWVVQHDIR